MFKGLFILAITILLVVLATVQCQPQTYRQVKICCEKPPDVVISHFPNYYIILYNVSTECFYVPVPASNHSGKITLLYKLPLKNAYKGIWLNVTPSTETLKIFTLTQENVKKLYTIKREKTIIHNQTYLLILLTSGLAEAYPESLQPCSTGFTTSAETTKTAETGFRAGPASPIKLLFQVLPYIIFSLIISAFIYAYTRKAVQYNEEQAETN